MQQQELPPCPWHPGKLCPGECQYILARDKCWADLADGIPEPGRDEPGENR